MRDLDFYAKKCKNKLIAIDIPISNNIQFRVNTRAKARWGRCRRKDDGYIIEISVELLREDAYESGLENTILHELLHTCPNCLNHGSEWKRLAAKVNRVYGCNIKRTDSYQDKGLQEPVRKEAPDKYLVVCQKCGASFGRKKKSSLITEPERFRCARCGGKFTIREL
jgi:predicted SprT family Zn-dependent metalloprotease